jgi:glycosyltransferase involved in cell wall biosynthesis
MPPLVSICIPNRNMARYIGTTLESVLAQTWMPLEVVVLDNDSNDNSWSIIQGFASKDPRVHAYRTDELLPIVRNHNRCMALSKGHYINLLCADDLLEPTFVERCMELFQREKELGYVSTERTLIGPDGDALPSTDFYQASGIIPGLAEARINLIGSHTVPPQMLIRKTCFEAIDWLDTAYEWGFDIHAKIRLNLQWDVGYLNEPLCHYRMHPENSSSRYKSNKMAIMTIYRLKLAILENLPEHARELVSSREPMLANLARTCVTYAEEALGDRNLQLAREYLRLGASFRLEVEKEPLWQWIDARVDGSGAPRPEAQGSKKKLEGPPYPLPDGARSL